MKVLETRHVHERIMLMAWSPRMDLLAVVNAHGMLFLLPTLISIESTITFLHETKIPFNFFTSGVI